MRPSDSLNTCDDQCGLLNTSLAEQQSAVDRI
jgi:hypothetical protein